MRRGIDTPLVEEVIFPRVLKNVQMLGSRNSEK